MTGVVILGAGQAGVQCAESLRQEGYADAITVIGDEPHMPYQRPPLSKAYLLGQTDHTRIRLRPPAFYDVNRIDLRLGVRAAQIDRVAKQVILSDGETVPYAQLVLALGARVRPLPVEGATLAGVFSLRTLDDVDAIARRIEPARNVVVVGAGFIGLEFAAVANKLGKAVTVVEALDRVMARVVSPELSTFFETLHRSHGVTLLTGTGVSRFEGEGTIEAVTLADGRSVEVDLVVVGIGVLPNVELAETAGIDCDSGVRVDAYARTSDPSVYAIGDCASYAHPFVGRLIRLESVQNAGDQARTAAASICGKDKPYIVVPWFWSDQYDAKFQLAGLSLNCDRHVVRGAPDTGRFSVFYFSGEQLRSVAAVNKAADYIVGRKLLEAGLSPSAGQVADEQFPLKSLVA